MCDLDHAKKGISIRFQTLKILPLKVELTCPMWNNWSCYCLDYSFQSHLLNVRTRDVGVHFRGWTSGGWVCWIIGQQNKLVEYCICWKWWQTHYVCMYTWRIYSSRCSHFAVHRWSKDNDRNLHRYLYKHLNRLENTWDNSQMYWIDNCSWLD